MCRLSPHCLTTPESTTAGTMKYSAFVHRHGEVRFSRVTVYAGNVSLVVVTMWLVRLETDATNGVVPTGTLSITTCAPRGSEEMGIAIVRPFTSVTQPASGLVKAMINPTLARRINSPVRSIPPAVVAGLPFDLRNSS